MGESMSDFIIKRIRECPEYIEEAAGWFAGKWDVPVEAYSESMKASVEDSRSIPEWYVVFHHGSLIAGAGVIDNDFHNRKDLAPNLCALYVEENYRSQGIAGEILKFARKDFGDKGIKTLYLVTGYTGLYEKYGWEFHTVVNDDEGTVLRMYAAEI